MEYDIERVRTLIEKAVRREDARPSFYAITGSHLYGFPSGEGGDVDVRGFHLADGARYALLDPPEEQLVVNQGAVTEGFEEYAEIDLVSYELRKFGSLVAGANFNVLEVLFDGIQVVNGSPLEVDSLKALVEDELPLDVPSSYVGMAKTNYYKHLNPNKPSYDQMAKHYLYVLRGLMGAQYVLDEETITADVRTLSEHVLGTTDLVDALVDVKADAEDATVGEDLAARADATITDLFNEVEPPSRVDKSAYRARIDDWMLKVRG